MNNIIDNIYLHACKDFLARWEVVLAEGLRTFV